MYPYSAWPFLAQPNDSSGSHHVAPSTLSNESFGVDGSVLSTGEVSQVSRHCDHSILWWDLFFFLRGSNSGPSQSNFKLYFTESTPARLISFLCHPNHTIPVSISKREAGNFIVFWWTIMKISRIVIIGIVIIIIIRMNCLRHNKLITN